MRANSFANRFASLLAVLPIIMVARAAAAQCESNIDCKADRVCEAGVCVEPPAADLASKALACTRDIDCEGSRICEEGRCVAQGSVPAAAPATMTREPERELADPERDRGPQLAPPAAAPHLNAGLVFVPRLGAIGQGTAEVREQQVFNGSSNVVSADGDHAGGLVFGVDLLYAVTPTLRLGAGLNATPDTRARIEGTELSFGMDGSALGIVEGAVQVSGSVALLMRGQGGLAVLVPGGDLQDQMDKTKSDCQASHDTQCVVGKGPFFGSALGASLGVIFVRDGVRPRLELGWSRTQVKYADVDLTSGGNTASIEGTLTATRVVAMAGLEI